jgi:hypothetical protein
VTGLDIFHAVDYASLCHLRGIIRAKKPDRDEKSGDISGVGQAYESDYPSLHISNNGMLFGFNVVTRNPEEMNVGSTRGS